MTRTIKLADKYNAYLKSWQDCERCPLHKTRHFVVMHRGSLPAKVALFGEAPGDSENLDGRPFRGNAGNLLNEIIEEAWSKADSQANYILANLVGCLPSAKVRANDPNTDEEPGSWEPTKKEIMDCSPRVVQFLKIVKPKIIVALGKQAATYLPKFIPDNLEHELIKLPHPAAILRSQSQTAASSMYRHSITRLANALIRMEHLNG